MVGGRGGGGGQVAEGGESTAYWVGWRVEGMAEAGYY